MRKSIAILVTALLLLAAPMRAQIVILDNELEGELRTGFQDYNLTVPYQGGTFDQQYAPIGDGLVALSLLGGAYLLNKKRKKKE